MASRPQQPPTPLPQAPMVARQPGQPSVSQALSMDGAVDTTPAMPPIGPKPVAGLNHMLADRFGRLQQAVQAHGGQLYIFSGARDQQQQAQLFHDASSKFGSEQEAKKRVALPGKSHHDPHAGLQHGLGDGAVGVDVRGDLAIAHKLAAHFGLEFDGKTPWHLSIAGLKGGR